MPERLAAFSRAGNGGSWSAINTGLTSLDVRALVVDPAGALYAGTNGGGVFKSSNGGTSWSAINTRPHELCPRPGV